MRQGTAFVFLALSSAALVAAQVAIHARLRDLDPGTAELSLPFRVAIAGDMAIMRKFPVVLLGAELLAPLLGLGVGAWLSTREGVSRRANLLLWSAACALGSALTSALWWTLGFVDHMLACTLLSVVGYVLAVGNMYAIVHARSGRALALVALSSAGVLQLMVSPLAGIVVPIAVWFRSGSRA
jgi:hypothetical protein